LFLAAGTISLIKRFVEIRRTKKSENATFCFRLLLKRSSPIKRPTDEYKNRREQEHDDERNIYFQRVREKFGESSGIRSQHCRDKQEHSETNDILALRLKSRRTNIPICRSISVPFPRAISDVRTK
jgi:hypothetical protein